MLQTTSSILNNNNNNNNNFRWEEEKNSDGRKWTFLEHKGVVFADPYEPLPPNIQMKYDGKAMELTQDTEEVAGFYARMLDHDYVTKEIFNKNFFKDFRKVSHSTKCGGFHMLRMNLSHKSHAIFFLSIMCRFLQCFR